MQCCDAVASTRSANEKNLPFHGGPGTLIAAYISVPVFHARFSFTHSFSRRHQRYGQSHRSVRFLRGKYLNPAVFAHNNILYRYIKIVPNYFIVSAQYSSVLPSFPSTSVAKYRRISAWRRVFSPLFHCKGNDAHTSHYIYIIVR